MGAQTELHATPRGRAMAMDSAYDVVPANRERDVVVNASYCGVLPARFIAEQRPRGAIGVDCGVGPAGASVAGLWYLEALNMLGRVGEPDDIAAPVCFLFSDESAFMTATSLVPDGGETAL